MHAWCQAAESEVSGLGLVDTKPDGLLVREVYLPSQACTSSATEIDEKDEVKLVSQLMRQGEKPQAIRLWWHTHYNFNVFWSHTDWSTVEKRLKDTNDWLLSVVINQKMEYKARLDIFKPFRIVLDDLDILVEDRPGVIKKAENDIKSKIRKPEMLHDQKTINQNLTEFYRKNGKHGYNHHEYNWGKGWPETTREDIHQLGFQHAKNYSRIKIIRDGKEGWLEDGVFTPIQDIKPPEKTSKVESDGTYAKKYFNERIKDWMVWSEELKCYVQQGHESDTSFTVDGKNYNREELKKMMEAGT